MDPRSCQAESARGTEEERPEVMRYLSEVREEYDRLQYLWGEELYSDSPDWEQMEQWNTELKGLEEQLAGTEVDEWF